MSPREAGQIELEEPVWRDEFAVECDRWPHLPKELQENEAFESLLKRYRRFHAVDGKPATAYEGMVGLLRHGVLPPRSLIKDIPHGGEPFQEQHDAQCWVIMSQRAWRVTGVEDRMLYLDSFGEQTSVSLEPRKWLKHTEMAVEWLAVWPK